MALMPTVRIQYRLPKDWLDRGGRRLTGTELRTTRKAGRERFRDLMLTLVA